MKMRCFLAIDLCEDVKFALKRLEEDVKKCEADVKLVGPENVHFTIKFLGEVEENRLDEIKSAVEDVLKHWSAFKITVAGMGFHGSERFVRNVWIGVGEGREGLVRLFEEINDSLEAKNFRSETYPANPHITVCRIRAQKNIKTLLRLVKDRGNERFGEFLVNEVKLKRSELSPKGPKYSDIFTCSFGAYGLEEH